MKVSLILLIILVAQSHLPCLADASTDQLDLVTFGEAIELDIIDPIDRHKIKLADHLIQQVRTYNGVAPISEIQKFQILSTVNFVTNELKEKRDSREGNYNFNNIIHDGMNALHRSTAVTKIPWLQMGTLAANWAFHKTENYLRGFYQTKSQLEGYESSEGLLSPSAKFSAINLRFLAASDKSGAIKDIANAILIDIVNYGILDTAKEMTSKGSKIGDYKHKVQLRRDIDGMNAKLDGLRASYSKNQITQREYQAKVFALLNKYQRSTIGEFRSLADKIKSNGTSGKEQEHFYQLNEVASAFSMINVLAYHFGNPKVAQGISKVSQAYIRLRTIQIDFQRNPLDPKKVGELTLASGYLGLAHSLALAMSSLSNDNGGMNRAILQEIQLLRRDIEAMEKNILGGLNNLSFQISESFKNVYSQLDSIQNQNALTHFYLRKSLDKSLDTLSFLRAQQVENIKTEKEQIANECFNADQLDLNFFENLTLQKSKHCIRRIDKLSQVTPYKNLSKNRFNSLSAFTNPYLEVMPKLAAFKDSFTPDISESSSPLLPTQAPKIDPSQWQEQVELQIDFLRNIALKRPDLFKQLGWQKKLKKYLEKIDDFRYFINTIAFNPDNSPNQGLFDRQVAAYSEMIKKLTAKYEKQLKEHYDYKGKPLSKYGANQNFPSINSVTLPSDRNDSKITLCKESPEVRFSSGVQLVDPELHSLIYSPQYKKTELFKKYFDAYNHKLDRSSFKEAFDIFKSAFNGVITKKQLSQMHFSMPTWLNVREGGLDFPQRYLWAERFNKGKLSYCVYQFNVHFQLGTLSSKVKVTYNLRAKFEYNKEIALKDSNYMAITNENAWPEKQKLALADYLSKPENSNPMIWSITREATLETNRGFFTSIKPFLKNTAWGLGLGRSSNSKKTLYKRSLDKSFAQFPIKFWAVASQDKISGYSATEMTPYPTEQFSLSRYTNGIDRSNCLSCVSSSPISEITFTNHSLQTKPFSQFFEIWFIEESIKPMRDSLKRQLSESAEAKELDRISFGFQGLVSLGLRNDIESAYNRILPSYEEAYLFLLAFTPDDLQKLNVKYGHNLSSIPNPKADVLESKLAYTFFTKELQNITLDKANNQSDYLAITEAKIKLLLALDIDDLP